MSQTLEAQLANLSIKEKDVANSIFTHCMQETLHEIWAKDNPQIESIRIAERKKVSSIKKSELVTAILLGVNNTAAQCLVERLTKQQVRELCATAPIVHKINYTKKDGSPKDIPLVVLQKRLRQMVTVKSPFTQGLDDENTPPGTQHFYLGDFFDKFHAKNTELLKDLCTTFDIQVSASAKNSELRQALVDGLNLSGLYVFLEGLSMDLLRDVAENNGFEDVDSVTSKSRLIEALLTGKMPEPKVLNKAPKSKGKKRSIGNSDKHGLQQHYTAKRLLEYCQDHNLKSSGNKAQLIDRIIAWRNCETEDGKRKYERKTPYEGKPKSSRKSKKEESDDDSVEEESDEEVVEKKSRKSSKKNRRSESKSEKVVEEEEEVVEKASEKSKKSPKIQSEEKVEEKPEAAKELPEEKAENSDVEEAANRKILRAPADYEIAELRAYCKKFDIDVEKKGKRATKEEYVSAIQTTVTSADPEDLVLLDVEVLRKHCVDNKLGKKVEKASKEQLIKWIEEAPEEDD